MSALGHKRTNRPGAKSSFVRYRPKADIVRWLMRIRLDFIKLGQPTTVILVYRTGSLNCGISRRLF